MTDVTLQARSRPPRSAAAGATRRSFVAVVFGNLALLSGIVTMPILIAIGYLVRGHG